MGDEPEIGWPDRLVIFSTDGGIRAGFSAYRNENGAGRNGAGVLRGVQEEGGDTESKAGHPREQPPGSSRCVPEVRDQGFPYERSLSP